MYVVLEGIDTCGKSTQIQALKAHFPNAIFTKEPGGSELGHIVREIILKDSKPDSTLDSTRQSELDSTNNATHISNQAHAPHLAHPLSKEAEFFLFLADRAEHIDKVIKPNANKLIIADRSLISGIAYAKDIHKAKMLNLICTQGIVPDVCIVFTISKQALKKRLSAKSHDTIETRGVGYLLAIQKRILQTAKKLRKHKLSMRIVEIDATKSRDSITREIIKAITKHQNLQS